MLEIAAKFRRRNNIPEPGTNVGMQYKILNQLKEMAADELQTQSPGYNSGLMIDRVTDVASLEGKELYKLYSVKDTRNLTVNNDVRENMVPLESSTVFKNALDNNTVKLMHITENPDSNVIYTPMTFYLEGNTLKTKGMSFKDAAGKPLIDKKTGYPIIDLPFVRPDAHNLLREIYDTIKKDFDSRPYSAGQTIAGFGADTQQQHPMIIYSALRAGENKWTSTGLVFRLEVLDYDLKSVLDNILKEKPNYFKAAEVSKGIFDVFVLPKKISV
jgi:hypothetical protein